MRFFQGALPLPGVQFACVREEGGDDPPLQVAQEAGRLAAARLHALLADGRLQRPLPGVQPQQEADPLPLPQGKTSRLTTAASKTSTPTTAAST